MAWYADLSPCDEFGPRAAQVLRAVGWLDGEHDFAKGPVEREVYDRLVELCKYCWQPVVSFGVHDCELCRFVAEGKGTANLFVPGGEVIFVCPELIVHYMNAHRYQPPPGFCAAVLECPDMRSMEYKRSLLRSGGGALFAP